MEIIAEAKDGYLVHATKNEIKSILTAVSGTRPGDIEIGQRIPAIDYATTITKIKELGDDFKFKQLLAFTESVYNEIGRLKAAVMDAQKIEI